MIRAIPLVHVTLVLKEIEIQIVSMWWILLHIYAIFSKVAQSMHDQLPALLAISAARVTSR